MCVCQHCSPKHHRPSCYQECMLRQTHSSSRNGAAPMILFVMLRVCQAIASMKPGDVAIIFTPDDSHYSLAAACINAGLHVLVAKPIVKTLQEHKALVDLARKQNVMVRLIMGEAIHFVWFQELLWSSILPPAA